MGLLIKANSLSNSEKKGTGLLKNSLKYAAGEENKTAAFYKNFITGIGEFSTDIDFINYVLDAFMKYLNIAKIACLMYTSLTDEYCLWDSKGFNEQTIIRMRFSKTAASDFINSDIDTQGNNLQLYEKYFDTRDFSDIRNIKIVPFHHENQLICFFLLVNVDESYLNDTGLTKFFQENKVPGNDLIFKIRKEKIDELIKFDYISRENLEAEFTKQIQYAVKNSTLFSVLKLSIEDSLMPVLNKNPGVNRFVLQEDFVLLLANLFKNNGMMYNLKNGHVIFTINKLRKLDMNVLIDQLSKITMHYFSDLIKEENCEFNFKIYDHPMDSEDPIPILLQIYE